MNHDCIVMRQDGEVKICLPVQSGCISIGLAPHEAREFASKILSVALSLDNGAKDSPSMTVLVINEADRLTPVGELMITDPHATGAEPSTAMRLASAFVAAGSAYLDRLPP